MAILFAAVGVGAVAWLIFGKRYELPEGVKGTHYDREVTAKSGNTYRTRTWVSVVTPFPFGGNPGYTRAESIAIPGLCIGWWFSRTTGAKKVWKGSVPEAYSNAEALKLSASIKKDFGL
jgi:hypothetical protein